jgi:cytochrome c-type biogenesis protein CcmH
VLLDDTDSPVRRKPPTQDFRTDGLGLDQQQPLDPTGQDPLTESAYPGSDLGNRATHCTLKLPEHPIAEPRRACKVLEVPDFSVVLGSGRHQGADQLTLPRVSLRSSGVVARGLACVALALAVSPTTARAPASLTDIEDEVMCPICGTLLELSEAPQAERERAFIRRQIAAGRSKEQIKDALVAEYGQAVLATPDNSGFDLAAYLVPIAAFLGAAAALGLGVSRWRKGPKPPRSEDAASPQDDDAERLDSDMARYDL